VEPATIAIHLLQQRAGLKSPATNLGQLIERAND